MFLVIIQTEYKDFGTVIISKVGWDINISPTFSYLLTITYFRDRNYSSLHVQSYEITECNEVNWKYSLLYLRKSVTQFTEKFSRNIRIFTKRKSNTVVYIRSTRANVPTIIPYFPFLCFWSTELWKACRIRRTKINNNLSVSLYWFDLKAPNFWLVNFHLVCGKLHSQRWRLQRLKIFISTDKWI